MDSPFIVNFCPTGVVPSKALNVNAAVSVEEIVRDTREAYELGASIVHVHARGPEDESNTLDPLVYAEIIISIRRACPGIVVVASLSGRVENTVEARTGPLFLSGAARPDMGSLTLSSLNFSRSPSINTPAMIEKLLETMIAQGIKPELEAFDIGMIQEAKYLEKKGLLKAPHYFNLFCGNRSGAQADLLSAGMYINALPAGSIFSFAGLGDTQLRMNSLSGFDYLFIYLFFLFSLISPFEVSCCHGTRVGMEDNLYFDPARSTLASNGALVRRVVDMANAFGRKIATVSETRKMLGLGWGPDVLKLLSFEEETEVVWGEDVCLLDGDYDFTFGTAWEKEGFTVQALLVEEVNAVLRRFICQKVKESVGVILKPEEIDQYHDLVKDSHEAAFNALRGPHSWNELGEAGEKLLVRVEEMLGRKVSVFKGAFHLRVCRPESDDHPPDNNPFHKDIYINRLREMVNIFLPISGCNESSSLPLIAGSHRWPESRVCRTQNNFSGMGRTFSVPGIVAIRSVDDEQVIRPNPAEDQLMLFSPYLVHGNATNTRQVTRFSLETRFSRPVPPPKVWPRQVSKIGAGTMWYYKPWPKDQVWPGPPSEEEILNHLKAFLDKAGGEGTIYVDTAHSYRSEAHLGRALKQLPRDRFLVATKWGHDAAQQLSDFTLPCLLKHLEESHTLLGDFDLLYCHITGGATPDQVGKFFTCTNILNELLSIRHKQQFGVAWLGVSLSRADCIESFARSKMYIAVDVIQIPHWLCLEKKQFVAQARKDGKRVVINSVCRHRKEGVEPLVVLQSAINNADVDIVISGSKNHIAETLALQ
jgi:uncharacterized protein (DUF849 family)/diketogulonate reductase-like aldo/keto reductase